jgi:hypothetical protein
MRKLIISILVLTSLAASSQTKDHYGKYRFDSLYSTLAQKGIDTTNFKIVVERETDGKHFKMYWPTSGGGTTTNSLSIASELHSGGATSFNGSAAISLAIQAGSVTNSMLANNSITIAGNSTALGGSVTQDNITGLSSTGIVKRTGANTLAIATAGTDYQSPITLTTTGSSGAASFVAGTLNIPNYSVTSTSWNGGTNGTSYSATSATIDGNSLIWTFTGSSPATFTLPSYATFGNRVVLIKNIGSADLTITRAGTDQIYTTSAVTSFTLSAGKSVAISAAANGLTNTWETLFDPSTASSGVTGMAAIGSVPNANGASISGSTLTLQPADVSNGGVVINGTQTFGGNKTITGESTTTGYALNVLNSGATNLLKVSNNISTGIVGIGITPRSGYGINQLYGIYLGDNSTSGEVNQPYQTAPSTPTTGRGITYWKSDGKIYGKNDAGTEYDLTASAGGSGTVTSIDLTTPSWLTVSGSPVTTSGTLAVTATTGQTANRFLATPDGSTGAVSLRAIVAADIPTLNQNTTGSAAKFTTARNINGVAFDGTANITVPSDIAASTSGNVLTSNGTVWTSAANNGGWTTVRVSGSDATTTGQTLVDITGLASGTLTNSTKYEIEAVLDVSTSAVTTGTEYGIGAGGTGGAAVVSVILTGTTTGTSASSEGLSTTAGTASTARLLTSGQSGTIMLKGFVTTRGSGTATISVQHLKVTSGTSTVKVGSVFRYRLAQ